MINRSLMAALLLAGLSTTSAYAQSPKEQFDAETKRISARYADDKKLCADENNSTARMQCLRDAKTEYDKSMSQARAQYKGTPSSGSCHDCGQVISVATGKKAGEGSDTVYATVSQTLGDNVENLVLLDAGKPQSAVINGAKVLVYGMPKSYQLDYQQGDAVEGWRPTAAGCSHRSAHPCRP